MKDDELTEFKINVYGVFKKIFDSMDVLDPLLQAIVERQHKLEDRIKRLEGLYGIGEAGKN